MKNRTVWRSPEYRVLLSRRIKEGWLRVKVGEGFLYVIEGHDKDTVKIGHALNVIKRRYDLGMTRCPILATMPATREQELLLHKTLRETYPECKDEHYPRGVLNHPAIPAALKVVDRSDLDWRKRPAPKAKRRAA